MSLTSGPVVLYRRWRLRDGVDLDDVAALVAERIVPHYRRLCPDARLSLEATEEGRVLAIQRWPSRAVLEQSLTGAAFEAWWQEYLPVLVAWDALAEWEAEWEGVVLVEPADPGDEEE